MPAASPSPRPLRVPKRKASAYADALFDTQKKALAQSLVSLRLARGLSQEALAYEAEVERSYVSLIERGQSNPGLRVLCQLAQRLGVSVIEMMGGPQPTYASHGEGAAVFAVHEPGPGELSGQDQAAARQSSGNS